MPALLVLCLAQFMVILDITVVNVALPEIQTDLGFALGDLQWVITTYTLAFGGLLLLGGRAGDLFGRRRMFLTGLAVFTAASLAAAFAASPGALLAARGAQGVGAALLSPAALALITTTFDGRERQRALAAWAAVAASGGAFGVLAGGALTETFGWQAVFVINVPVGLAIAFAARRTLPRGVAANGGRLDLPGAALVVIGLSTLIYGLVEAPEAGWASAQTLLLLAGSVAALAAFVAVEAHVREPLVQLSVFRRRTTVVALLIMLAGMGTVMSAFFFLTLYLQQTLGHSALRTGLEFLPGAVLLVLAAHAGGHLVGRLGVKPVLAGGMAIGALGALVLSDVSAGGSYAGDVLPGLLVLDVGIGLAASGIFITAMSGVGHDEAGLVSGLTTTAHEIGIALVLAALSSVAFGGALASLGPAALADGFADGFRGAAAIAIAASLLAALALRRSDVAPGTHAAFAH